MRGVLKNVRRRATDAQMQERAAFLIDYARNHGPVTVRQLYYAAEVAGLPGIEKTEQSYSKIAKQVLALRRDGSIPYHHISDGTRSALGGEYNDSSRSSWQESLHQAAACHSFPLWFGEPHRVQVWLEKDALAGVVAPALQDTRVPLYVARGQTSETFAHEAMQDVSDGVETVHVYALFDCDLAGMDAANALYEKLCRFSRARGFEIKFNRLALYPKQVTEMRLPTREPKPERGAIKRWPHSFAAELDAIPPDRLRAMVRKAIETHMPNEKIAAHAAAVQAERAQAKAWLKQSMNG